MRTAFTLLIMAALFSFHRYFQSRRAQPPTAAESVLATGWLWFRRFVCFLATSLCALLAVLIVSDMVEGKLPLTGIIGLALAISFGFITLHWGMYGTGLIRYDYREDKPTHEQRKRRYGWRW